MENGNYGNANTDFRKLTLEGVPFTMFDGYEFGLTGCGANALALLTGVHPLRVVKENKNRAHYSDGFMVRFLREHGIRAFKVTKCNLTGRTKNTDKFLYGCIGANNLILTCQLLQKNEASWFVYWNGVRYHNFDVDRVSFSSLLNFPLINAYVLYNSRWAKHKK
jgi:hypothetical protein